MSYILDALKKSDRERQNASGPTIQTIQQPQLVGDVTQRVNWTLILIPCFIASVSVAVWTLSDIDIAFSLSSKQEQDNAVVYQPTTAEPVQVTPSVNEIQPLDTLNAPAVEVQQPGVDSQFDTIRPNTTSVGVEEEQAPIIQFHLLPESVKRDIPALTFSFHVFSENPAKRTIIINNRRMAEGAFVVDGLQLTQITTEGVIMQWKNHRFSINVVEQW